MNLITPIMSGLREAFFMFWETLWALVLGFTISGAVQAFVTRGQMQRALSGAGPKVLARAAVLGMVSSSCSYAAGAMAKSLFKKGADFVAAMIFAVASTNLVLELGVVLIVLMGWQFAAGEFAGGAIMIILLALIAPVAFPTGMVAALRTRVGAADVSDSTHHGERPRLLSVSGWTVAAGYTVADLRMVRRELILGFLIAGLLTAVVPDSFWRTVFVPGNGFLTSVENALVGPFIAIISFVCSIGNVPMAAALWNGGISFGGVVAFIFADLITLPLLMIYRKYYGTQVTLRLLISFWLVMSAAGLVVQYIFIAIGLVPSHQLGRTIAQQPVLLDYTTVLNIVALGVLLTLYALHRRIPAQSGNYSNDPVCGMQVEIASAPASLATGGETHYFCSEGCRDHFAAASAGIGQSQMP